MVNIAKLLKNAPKGLELYSPLFGKVKFLAVDSADSTIIVETERETHEWFSAHGKYKVMKSHMLYSDAECLLFPSKDYCTWQGWTPYIESNFKVGDWIVDNEGVFKITQYEDEHGYDLTDTTGCVVHFVSPDYVETKFHLWTIQDAKDGDVLVTEDYIFIFKHILHGGVHLYCHYDIDDEEFDSDIPDAIIGNIHDKGAHFQPAAKEQRDLFFAKMKEAGYTWDKKKKKLKKIPVKPNFKVGDWITDGTCKVKITAINNTCYWYSKNCIIGEIETIDKKYHLWAIQEDAKDGDVLVCYSEVKGNSIEQTGIFKQYVGRHGGCSNSFLAHTGIDWDGNIIINGYMGSTNILPATEEQCDQLFAKIKEMGYEWDDGKKEIKRSIKPKFKLHDTIMNKGDLYSTKTIMYVNNEKMTYRCSDGKDIPFSEQDLWHLSNSHYFIQYFKPKQWVLVRDCDNQVWGLSRFSHRDMGCFICINREDFRQCIPFEGNERLLGTTDMCDEKFINW